MRRFIFALVLAVFLAPFPIHARDVDDVIERYDVDVTLETDGSALIEERILYRFDRQNAHGIIREIPTYYTNSTGSATLPVNVLSVTDENGRDLTVLKTERSADISLRVGDADIVVEGSHWYYITYSIEDVVSRYETWDELHLDAIGTEWDASVLASTVTVTLPEPGFERAACQTGAYGSTETNCSFDVSPSRITYTLDQPLGKYEGFTIVAGFEQGLVNVASSLQVTGTPGAYINIGDGHVHFMNERIRVAPGTHTIEVEKMWHRTDTFDVEVLPGEDVILEVELKMTVLGFSLVYVLPLIIFILLQVALYRHYQKRGKHEPGRGVVIAQYAPEDGMYPALAGHLHNQIVDRRDLAASILSLAANGFLDI